MPLVSENPSRLFGVATDAEGEPEASGADLVEERLRALQQPNKVPPVQPLSELWQVMKKAMHETRRARVAAAQETESSALQR